MRVNLFPWLRCRAYPPRARLFIAAPNLGLGHITAHSLTRHHSPGASPALRLQPPHRQCATSPPVCFVDFQQGYTPSQPCSYQKLQALYRPINDASGQALMSRSNRQRPKGNGQPVVRKPARRFQMHQTRFNMNLLWVSQIIWRPMRPAQESRSRLEAPKSLSRGTMGLRAPVSSCVVPSPSLVKVHGLADASREIVQNRFLYCFAALSIARPNIWATIR